MSFSSRRDQKVKAAKLHAVPWLGGEHCRVQTWRRVRLRQHITGSQLFDLTGINHLHPTPIF